MKAFITGILMMIGFPVLSIVIDNTYGGQGKPLFYFEADQVPKSGIPHGINWDAALQFVVPLGGFLIGVLLIAWCFSDVRKFKEVYRFFKTANKKLFGE